MAISATLKAGHHPISKTKVLVVALFIIYPLGALPFILIEIYNQKKYAFTLLALFMGLCSILMAPSGDLYRHTLDYVSFGGMTYSDLWSGTEIHFDFVLDHISFLFAKLHLHFELVRCLFVCVSYLCVFWALNDIVKRNRALQDNRTICFAAFLAVFFAVEFFSITLGLRHGLATYLMATGIYKLFRRGQVTGWWLILISGLTHFSMIPIISLILLLRIFPFRLNKWFVIGVSGIVVLLSTTLLETAISALPLPEEIKAHALAYVSGYWANEFLEDRSALFNVARILSQISVYPLVIIFLLGYRNKDYTPFKGMLLINTLLLFLLYPISGLFTRFSSLMIPLYLFDLLTNFTPGRAKSRILRLILLCTLISFSSQVYAFRKHLTALSRMHTLAYSPAPYILCQEFDETWLDKHINQDGSPRF